MSKTWDLARALALEATQHFVSPRTLDVPESLVASFERRLSAAPRDDIEIPERCDEWYCTRHPVVRKASGEFLCKRHAEEQRTTARTSAEGGGAA